MAQCKEVFCIRISGRSKEAAPEEGSPVGGTEGKKEKK